MWEGTEGTGGLLNLKNVKILWHVYLFRYFDESLYCVISDYYLVFKQKLIWHGPDRESNS
jgi:hypothetical protein